MVSRELNLEGPSTLRPSTSKVTFRLDLDHGGFELRVGEFTADVARLLEIEMESVKLLAIRLGCVLVDMEIPSEALDLLGQILESEDEEVIATVTEFKRKWRFRKARESNKFELVAPLGKALSVGRQLSWIHFSDLHMRLDTGSSRFDQDMVVKNLTKQLPKLLHSESLDPDFVFFTGDVTRSAEESEFDAARAWFDSVLSSFDGRKHFYEIPGNHDVGWKNIEPTHEESMREKLKSVKSVNNLMLDDWDAVVSGSRAEIFRRQEQYRTFHMSRPNGATNHGSYFYTDVVEIDGLSVGIAGLNSAWFSSNGSFGQKGPFRSNIDIQHLILGEHQMATATSAIEDCDLRIALVHHPPASDWFTDFDSEMQIPYWRKFDFVLRGHMHRADVFEITHSHDGRTIHVAAGATSTGDRDYPKNFNAVRIDLDNGTGEFFLWSYLGHGTGWSLNRTKMIGMLSEFNLPARSKNRIALASHK